MFGFLRRKEKKAEQDIMEKADQVVSDIKAFIVDVFNNLISFSEFTIMSIGDHFSGSGTVQVWYHFHSVNGSPKDNYPMQEYKNRVLGKMKLNKAFTFKMFYYGSDRDGDFIGFTKEFVGEEGYIALDFICNEIERQRSERNSNPDQQMVIQ